MVSIYQNCLLDYGEGHWIAGMAMTGKNGIGQCLTGEAWEKTRKGSGLNARNIFPVCLEAHAPRNPVEKIFQRIIVPQSIWYICMG